MTPRSGKLVLGLIVLIATQLLSTAGQESTATNETVVEGSEAPVEERAPAPVLTGNPQLDYIHDPNLPRELKGYNLSDYPFYKRVPDVNFNFSCYGRHDGFYASIPHKCQVYHHCLFEERFDFLCANYTAFDQATFICQFANKVDCKNSELYFDRNDALYKEATTTTTKPPPPQVKIVYVERPRPIKRPKSTTPTYEYYETDPQFSDYYYYEDEPTVKPTTTTTTTKAPIRKNLPRPNRVRSGNPLRRQRPNNSGRLPGKRRRRKKTTTTTTTTPVPEYYDEYEYYDYYDPVEVSSTTTTQAPRLPGPRLSPEERRRKLLKSRKSKLQRITQQSRPVAAAAAATATTTTTTTSEPPQEPAVVDDVAIDYQYEDVPPANIQARRRGQRRRTRNRRLRNRTPGE